MLNKYTFVSLLLSLLFFNSLPLKLKAQYTRQDSLRGSLSPARSCYDVFYYDLNVRVVPEKKFIKGHNDIYFTATTDFSTLQIDLFEAMKINTITDAKGNPLVFKREGNATFITFATPITKGTQTWIRVSYEGEPRVAINAPWDGGFSWAEDAKKRTWIGVSCEGLGASVWYPNKDHLSEEPDSMRIACEVPKALTCVINGNLYSTTPLTDDYVRYDWRVSYPINNYNVSLNIGYYAHFSDTYQSPQDGSTLALDYYVLDYNLEKAKTHFQQVKPMLECYEKFFGKYPFWRDGFALIETPYLGMEHQSGIAYGNNYLKGYRNYDLTGTGIGLLFDYLIIHETGHEYWGNNVGCYDHAELWIHESFCTYSEALYIECLYGKEKADAYIKGYQSIIENDKPIIGDLGVNGEGSGDMYSKGANVLHTLRHYIDNDPIWFDILKGLQKDFALQMIDTKTVINYINQKTGKDFNSFFQQYLYETQPPVLEYSIKKKGEKYLFTYSWNVAVKDFAMPLIVKVGNQVMRLEASATQKTISLSAEPILQRQWQYYNVVEKK
ncbi:MAG: M1 family peptidase [Cytophagales bacterium]|nr:MAG: M1 family peptidase [Cytophagales bacterium]